MIHISLKDKSKKKLKCRLLTFLFVALRVKRYKSRAPDKIGFEDYSKIIFSTCSMETCGYPSIEL